KIFNHGDMIRDFTYIDDIVEGVIRTLDNTAQADADWSGREPNPATSYAPYRIYNIGNNQPVKLLDFIEAIEEAVGKKAVRELMPIQPGDVPATFADVSALERDVGFKPTTSVVEGIRRFVEWYREYYRV